VKTSWNAINDQNLRDISLGRLGYSVKLVPYQSLTGRLREPSTSAGGAWSNFLQPDGELTQDLDYLEH